MGRGSQVKKTYITINGGKIVERIGSTTERNKAKEVCPSGAVPREIIDKKTGTYQKTVFERRDDFIEGIITRVSLRDGDYGWELHITIRDMSDEFILSIPANSDYFKHFAKKAQNIKNPAAMVRFTPFDFVAKDGIRRRGITMTQMGEPITWFFTKDDHRGMPEFTKAPKGKDYQDWPEDVRDEYTLYMKKRDRWLRNYVTAEVSPMFTGNDLPEPSFDEADTEPVKVVKEGPESDLDDDLPF